MGSFAAATFKRGIRFINVPTTLLCAVDACVGGKTGINFNGLKNEIGMFRDADLAIISTLYFNTLTSQELLSGYAEMIKHALVSSMEQSSRILSYDVTSYNPDSLLALLEESVGVKQKYVVADHEDRGARRALNFGHTIGHAFESLALERKSPLAHGYAVAFGMVGALVLSRMKLGFPSEILQTMWTMCATITGRLRFHVTITRSSSATCTTTRRTTVPGWSTSPLSLIHISEPTRRS